MTLPNNQQFSIYSNETNITCEINLRRLQPLTALWYFLSRSVCCWLDQNPLVYVSPSQMRLPEARTLRLDRCNSRQSLTIVRSARANGITELDMSRRRS